MASIAPTSLDQLQDGQEVPASLLPSNLPNSPDNKALDAMPDGAEVAPDTSQLRRAIDADPYFPVTPATAKILYDADNAKGFGGRLSETATAIPSGIGALADQIGAAHEQMSKVPFPTSRNEVERLSNTITEAGAEGALNTWGLAKRAGLNFWDWVKEKVTGANDDEKIANYAKELQLKQQTERAMRGLPDTRPENFDPSAPSFVLKGYGDAPPYDKAAQVMSMPLDPTFMVGAGALGPLTEAAMKIPGVAKVAQLAEAAKVAGSRALPAAAGAVEQTARAVKNVAAYPAEKLEEKLTSLGGITKIVAGGAVASHFPVIGHVAKLLATGEAGASAVEQTASFLRRLSETSGDQIRSRLLQLAQNPETPAWMATTAGNLDKYKIGNLAQYVGDLSESAAHGGITGAALATAAGASPEERGQMIGTGLGLGALGRSTRMLTGADAAARRVLADIGAKQRFFERITAPVEKGGSGLTPDEARDIGDTTATVAGHAADLLGDSVNWKVLRPGEEIPGGEPGAAASYDPVTRTINFHLGDNTDRHLHEIAHAVDQASGAPGEARLLIDSLFTPDQMTQLGAQYAQRLTGSQDPAAVLAKMQQLNDAWKGDQWLYNEVYAEAGYGALQHSGQNMQGLLGVNRPPMLNRVAGQILGKIGSMARAAFFNHVLPDSFTQDGRPQLPRGAIFNDPAIYNSPELRKLIVQHLNQIRQAGATALQAKGDGSTVNMPERLLGKHPKAPKQMLMENGLALENARGELRRTMRGEERRADKTKAQQTAQALAGEPLRPKGDTTPNVAPRINSEGKTEISGTRITDLLNKIPGYGPFARGVAATAESLMGTGKAFKAGYFAVGTSEGGGNWRKSVARSSGDMPWQEIHLAPFEFKIDSKAHALVTGLSVTAADRKMARWAQEGKLDAYWNGDAQAFKRDLMTYLENHRDNRPGSDKIGEHKRDLLNLFTVGKLNPKEANPLRAPSSAQDRNGIIRSLRLDRISSMEDSDYTGWHAEYPKKKINFSPEADTEKEQLIRERIAAGMTPRDLRYTVAKDPSLPGWGFVQVDDPRDNNAFSSNPDQLSRLGMDMPGTTKDLLDRLPAGRFSHDQVVARLSGQEKEPVLFSPPVDGEDKTGVWYSRLENAIRSLPAGDTKPKTGQQWKGWIARMSQGQAIPTQGKDTYRGGIAQEEIKYSGLEDALQDGGKYTKAQVLDLLAKNAVQVQDVVSGPGVTVPDFGEGTYEDTQGMDEGQTYYSWHDGDYEIMTIVDDGEDPKKSGEYVINFTDPATDRGQGGRDVAKAYSWRDAVREAQDHAEQYNRSTGGGKYTDYKAMPGGENYRELLLTLPERSAPHIPHPEVLTELPAGYEYIHNQQGEPDKQWGIIPAKQTYARPLDDRWFRSQKDALYYTLADMNQRAEDKYKMEVRLANEAYNFDSQHWDEPNVLAHVRFDERNGPGGEKILFLQEMQSDWHQQGRERGYRQGSLQTINPLKEKHVARLAEIAKQVTDLGPQPHKFGTPREQADAHIALRETREILVATPTTSPGYEEALKNFKEAEAHMRLTVPGWGIGESGRADYTTVKPEDLAVILERNVKMGILPDSVKPLAEEARRIKTELDFINAGAARNNKAVPDAPYKHSWPEMAMRRMIKWAADHGFAKIAWTTGKQQAELYDLRKHVRGISYKDNGDHTYNVSAMLPNGAGHMLGEHMTQAQIEEHVGREIAAKITAGKGTEVNYAANNQPENIRKELRGLDLEIGGEGMKGFYDRMLPITAAKLARKYGGQVGTMKIRHPGETAFDLQGQNSRGEATRIRGFDNRAAAEAELVRLQDKPGGDSLEIIENPGETVHALALFNPKGLDDIRREGVPLFSPEVQDEAKREPFYSQLQRVVDEKFTGKQMPAAQLAAILRNPQNGVKADEMKWTGLDDFLQGKSRVTREEVQTFLQNNEVRVNEVTRGAPVVPKTIPPFTVKPTDHTYEAVDSRGKVLSYVGKGVVSSPEEAEDYLRRYLTSKFRDAAKAEREGKEAKYGIWQIPGGENYRELLFTIPPGKTFDQIAREIGYRNGWTSQVTPEDVKRIEKIFNAQPVSPAGGGFKSAHWDEDNVLAHVRYNDRVDQQGKKVKFIEEIQSDWHQQGRRKGYGPQPEVAKVLAEVRKLGITKPERQISPEDITRAFGSEDLAQSWWGLIQSGALSNGAAGVPEAPLKNTWQEMVFRRMVALAAEEGADKIAWTTGEQQAERYNLSKQIDQIQYRKQPDGTINFSVWKDGKSLDQFERMDSSIDEAEKLFGKEIAKRMEQNEGRELTQSAHDDIVKRGPVTEIFHSPANGGGWFARFKDGSEMGRWISQEDTEHFAKQIENMIKSDPQRVLEGEGLKVGGAGMKAFYDKMLVDYANKFGKKFGARVRDTYLSPTGKAKVLANDNAASAAAIGAAPVHALDITPEMRKTAAQGVPLFSPDVRGEYWINENGVDFADGDVGDMNHENYAVQHAATRILDLFHADTDEEFYDEDTFRNAIIEALNEDDEEGKADKNNWTKLAEDYIKANVAPDKLEQTLDEFETAQGKGDARDTAVKHWGWVWVRGTHASTWTLTKDDMKNIADGYREIADQEGLGEDDPESNLDDMEINIHVASTGRRVSMTLGELESGRTPSVDPTWPGQIPPK